MRHDLYHIVKNFSRKMNERNISAYASSTAFFFFLSLVPMILTICTLLPFTPLTEANLLTAVAEVMPAKIYPLAEGLIREVYDMSVGMLPLAALATLWSAGKGMLALIRGLNAVGDIRENRNYIILRIVSTFYTVVMLVMVLISLIGMVFGNRLVDMILYRLPSLRLLFALLLNLRFLAGWVILTILFCFIYAYVPNGRRKLWEQLPGAAFTAVVWSVFSWGFSLYVDWMEEGIYGSLTIVILIMLWMYSCMYIVLLGAYLNFFFLPANRMLITLRKNRRQKKAAEAGKGNSNG